MNKILKQHNEEMRKEFEREFVRKNAETKQSEWRWFLKEYITGKEVWQFIETQNDELMKRVEKMIKMVYIKNLREGEKITKLQDILNQL